MSAHATQQPTRIRPTPSGAPAARPLRNALAVLDDVVALATAVDRRLVVFAGSHERAIGEQRVRLAIAATVAELHYNRCPLESVITAFSVLCKCFGRSERTFKTWAQLKQDSLCFWNR